MPGQPTLPPDATPTASDQALLDAVFSLQSSVDSINTTIEGIGLSPELILFGAGIVTALAFIAGIRSAGMFIFLLMIPLLLPGEVMANNFTLATDHLDAYNAAGTGSYFISESSETIGQESIGWLIIKKKDTAAYEEEFTYSLNWEQWGTYDYSVTRTKSYCDGTTTVSEYDQQYSVIKEDTVVWLHSCVHLFVEQFKVYSELTIDGNITGWEHSSDSISSWSYIYDVCDVYSITTTFDDGSSESFSSETCDNDWETISTLIDIDGNRLTVINSGSTQDGSPSVESTSSSIIWTDSSGNILSGEETSTTTTTPLSGDSSEVIVDSVYDVALGAWDRTTSTTITDNDNSDGKTSESNQTITDRSDGSTEETNSSNSLEVQPDGTVVETEELSNNSYDPDGGLIEGGSSADIVINSPDGSTEIQSTTSAFMPEDGSWEQVDYNSTSTPSGEGFEIIETTTNTDTFIDGSVDGTKTESSGYEIADYSSMDSTNFELIDDNWVEVGTSNEMINTDSEGTKTTTTSETPNEGPLVESVVNDYSDGSVDSQVTLTDTETNQQTQLIDYYDVDGNNLLNSVEHTDLTTGEKEQTITVTGADGETTTDNIQSTISDGVETTDITSMYCYWMDGIEICNDPTNESFQEYTVETTLETHSEIIDGNQVETTITIVDDPATKTTIETTTTTTTLLDGSKIITTDTVVNEPTPDYNETLTTTTPTNDGTTSPDPEPESEPDPVNITAPTATGSTTTPDNSLLAASLDSKLAKKGETFVSIYEQHYTNWMASDLFTFIDNFSLALPSSLPSFSLVLPRWSVDWTFDLNQWGWMFDVVRILVIMSALFYSYKIIFKG